MSTVQRAISRVVIGGMLASMWTLRQFDRLKTGSTSARTADAFRRDPYPSWELIRMNGSVLRSYANQGWIVVGYREAQDALRSPHLSSDITRNRFFLAILRMATAGRPVPFIDYPPLLNQDPPNHTRLRRLASSGFTLRFIQSLAPRIEAFVSTLLDQADVAPEFDVISALAEPLPAMVITEMMGVPDADRAQFTRWSHQLTGATVIDQPELIEQAAMAEQEMRQYLQTLVAAKQREPGEDFISQLVRAEVEDDSLTRDEVISTCILLLTAGHETTTRLIGNGLVTLIQHPEQLARLRQNPDLLDPAIEEMLRFEPPVQMTLRFVRDDHDFHGQSFKRGQMVMINLAAANRDPSANPDPATFDITRESTKHIAFGYGIHLCLGLTLARLEARLVFSELLRRYSRIEIVEKDLPWQGNPFFRGLERLSIKVCRSADTPHC